MLTLPPFQKLVDFLDRRWLRSSLLIAVLVVLGWAVLGELQKLLAEVSYRSIIRVIRHTPYSQMALAALTTALSYLALTGYDSSSLRFVRAKVPAKTVGMTSFIAFALGNTVGLGPLTGGAVRLRLYTAAGVEPLQVTRAIAFSMLAFGIGAVAFGSMALLWGAPAVAHLWGLPSVVLRGIAIVLLGLVVVFLILCARRRRVRLGRWRVVLPPVTLALRQLVTSGFDLLFAALTLWVLLPASDLPFLSFLTFYAMALALGIISHVPGGIGVFEAVMLVAVGTSVPIDQLTAALLLYRLIYFLVPLGAATTLLVGYEVWLGRRSPVVGFAAPIARAAVRLTPQLLAVLVFIGGMTLLVSGATPASHSAAELLSVHVPLAIVESAHLIGSIVGLLLLILARGLLHRLDGAWWGAVVATGVGFWLALPKGIALHEMALLGFLFVLLVVSRRQFNRKSSLFAQHLDVYWIITICIALAAVLWILFFAYRNVAYSQQLWWRFEFNANAPRSLRAMMAVAIVGLAIAVWQLLRRPTGSPKRPSAEELNRAKAILDAQDGSSACLALAGDKSLLFSPSGKSFIMYGKQRRSWVALFDPVGPREEWPDLIWSFIELANAHGGRAAFYQVHASSLSLYLDAGMKAFKLGEFAWVPLTDFNLKGGKRANLRTAYNRAERDGLTFEVLAPEKVAPMLPELRKISDAWLDMHHTREKGFSLGAFSDAYLDRGPVAIVRSKGELVAFASLMETATRREAGIDLMRESPASTPGTMDYLFVKLILYYQAAGFERFGLGMAPLSGMADHELASLWHRVGRLLFGHGERFYHFRGLRNFKEKFSPVWEPRYLTAAGFVAPLLVLADTAVLIGRGRSN